MGYNIPLITFCALVFLFAWYIQQPYSGPKVDKVGTFGSHPKLENQPGAEPGNFPVINFPTKIGWPEGLKPKAPKDFAVSLYATTEHGRWILPLPNGDVLVAESRTVVPKEKKTVEHYIAGYLIGKAGNAGDSPNRIILLRDSDGDGVVDFRSVLVENLSQPLGMALHKGFLYVGNTDEVLRFPYTAGAASIDRATGKTIAILPKGGYNNHWTRNLFIHNEKLYVSVGSASNIGEHGLEEEVRRACVLEMDLDGSNERVYSSGIRNPVGLDVHPKSGVMWTVVNERDLLGDDMVPDYFTRVRSDDFYGWPWWYWRDHVDARVEIPKPSRIPNVAPDYALGPHTASLGLAFYTHTAFPVKYRNGAFIGQHGSWNRRNPSGYAVAFVPFNDSGMPSQETPEDFLTGFLQSETEMKVYGRPVGVAVAKDGALLVADDSGGRIWRVAYTGND